MPVTRKRSVKKSPKKSPKKHSTAILLHASSDDPDMQYFSGFRSSDPFVAFKIGRKKYGVAVPMEFGRMVRESSFDEVLLASELREGAIKRFKLANGATPDQAQTIAHIAKLHGINRFSVGSRFPVGLAFKLQKAGLKLDVAPDNALLPERQIKTESEVEALKKGNRASAAGFRAVTKTLKESKIRGDKLIHKGSVLTSERLQDIIAQATFAEGAIAADTIAAGGDQACDCHEAGHGPIRPNELIVVDIFPRRVEDGYWGDMTRTFLKGTASDAQRRLVRTVKRGLDLSFRATRPGVACGKLQKEIEDFFAKEGYKTVRDSTEPEGFFHALGHAIGLEVHEDPVIRRGSKVRLKQGMVVTLEPGLYYRGLGGVRIEDVVHLVKGGNEKISSAPYKWEIA